LSARRKKSPAYIARQVLRLEEDGGKNLLNVPNTLAAIRLVGSLAAFGVAYQQWSTAYLLLLVVLMATDFVDGKLAILLNQRTVFGARLDSVADATMYASVLFAAYWMKYEVLRREAWWIGAALATYALSITAGLLKFRRLPSYHTRSAKTSWLLMGIAIVSLFAFTPYSAWPIRLAMLKVTVTNLETTLMTFVLPAWTADLPSLLHAWRARSAHSPPPQKNTA